jgi:AraC-like DNA-binding protein
MSSKLRSPQNDLYRKLCVARDFIAECHAEALDLITISRKADLSPFYFLRAFRGAFEQTPHEYLTRVRLSRARQLLASSELPVTQICFEIGFSSLGSFSALFSKRMGTSPSAYRRGARRLVQVKHELVKVVPFCFYRMFVGTSASA